MAVISSVDNLSIHYGKRAAVDGISFELHAGAVRFSFEWSRLFPEKGVVSAKGVAYYHRLLAALRQVR